MERLAVLTELDRRMLEALQPGAQPFGRLPALLEPVRERLAGSLYRVMNEVTTRLAGEIADAVYRHDRI